MEDERPEDVEGKEDEERGKGGRVLSRVLSIVLGSELYWTGWTRASMMMKCEGKNTPEAITYTSYSVGIYNPVGIIQHHVCLIIGHQNLLSSTPHCLFKFINSNQIAKRSYCGAVRYWSTAK